MQHKRRISPLRMLVLLVVLVLIGGTAVLMTATIPAPSKAVEKPLDIKAFLEQPQS